MSIPLIVLHAAHEALSLSAYVAAVLVATVLALVLYYTGVLEAIQGTFVAGKRREE